jgi:hypothetical protein
MSTFALSYAANMFILMFFYEFSFLPGQFCYIIVYIRKIESSVEITDRCATCKIVSGENAILKSKSKLFCDWRFSVSQFVFASIFLGLTTRDFFQVNPCGHRPYVTSSMTKNGVVPYEYAWPFVKHIYRTNGILLGAGIA